MPESRIDIAPSLVARLVAEQFPQWANLQIRAVEPGGWDNNTFRLGEDMSLRLPSAERYAAQVEKEQTWLPRLAPQLPLAIPEPYAMGHPAEDYPWHWSVYRWLEGESASSDRIADLNAFAVTLAQFLLALQQIDSTGGPLPGAHNFFRGGSLATYDAETRGAIASLQDRIDVDAVAAVWEIALESTWQGEPVWLHGDVAAANLLMHQGNLHAVIDFGCSGIGDPACDYAIAWTLFSGDSRETFRSAIAVDDATWARGLGWALWKGLITLTAALGTDPLAAEAAQQTIDAIVVNSKHITI